MYLILLFQPEYLEIFEGMCVNVSCNGCTEHTNYTDEIFTTHPFYDLLLHLNKN